MRWTTLITALLSVAATLGACRPAAPGEAVSTVANDQWAGLDPAGVYSATSSLFGDGVHELHVHLRRSTFTKMVTHKDQGGDACKDDARYGRVERFVFKNAETGATHALENVGMRVRGNTSCGSFRKQFRFKFNADADVYKNKTKAVVERVSRVFEGDGDDVVFDGGEAKRIDKQTFYGLKSITLRTSVNDPAVMRDKLGSEVYAGMEDAARARGDASAAARGGPAYRAGYVKLYVHFDGGGAEDFGLYVLAEQIDKTFFKTRWNDDIAHAFQLDKARGTLREPPEDDDQLLRDYTPELFDGDSIDNEGDIAIYERLVAEGRVEQEVLDKRRAKRAEAADTIRKLIKAIAAAKNADDLTSKAKIDVGSVADYMVAANLVGHWDSAIGNANNDYLVYNKRLKSWRLAVWDMDNTFGSEATRDSPFNTVWDARYWEFRKGATSLLAESERPLFAKVAKFAGGLYKERYVGTLRGAYDLHALNDRIVKLRNQVTGSSAEEPNSQVVFKFKNRRWAHGTCGVTAGKVAVVQDGWPVFDSYADERPRCQ